MKKDIKVIAHHDSGSTTKKIEILDIEHPEQRLDVSSPTVGIIGSAMGNPCVPIGKFIEEQILLKEQQEVERPNLEDVDWKELGERFAKSMQRLKNALSGLSKHPPEGKQRNNSKQKLQAKSGRVKKRRALSKLSRKARKNK